MDAHLRDLRYFVAVAEELSFTRAAGRLFISQPALSRQIAKLEADLAVGLFRRDHRRIHLTAAGQALYGHATTLLADWDAARAAIAEAAASNEATLRIGMQASVGRGILAGLREGLERRRPGWAWQIAQVSWSDPTAGLSDGSCDVAVCWLPLPAPERYCHIPVATESRLLAVSREHRLAGRASIRFADMEAEPLIALPPEAGILRDHWLAAERREGAPPVAMTATTADAALEAVANGLGAALVAEGNVILHGRPDIAFVPVEDLGPSVLAVAWRADDHRPVIQDIADIARIL